jgi:hypothetical protein
MGLGGVEVDGGLEVVEASVEVFEFLLDLLEWSHDHIQLGVARRDPRHAHSRGPQPSRAPPPPAQLDLWAASHQTTSAARNGPR